MPCSDSGESQYYEQLKLDKIQYQLDVNERLRAQNKDLSKKADKLTRMLCEILQKEIGNSDFNVDYSAEINQWWKAHRKWDSFKENKENLEKEIQELNSVVYNKSQALQNLINEYKVNED